MARYQELRLHSSISSKITIDSSPIPSIPENDQFSDHNHLLVPRAQSRSLSLSRSLHRFRKIQFGFSSFFRSLLNAFDCNPTTTTSLVATAATASCGWLALSSTLSALPIGRKLTVTGTIFGFRRGHVSFAVQTHPRLEPFLWLAFPMSTSALIKEMSTGLVRIPLECPKEGVARSRGLCWEPVWTMYCNGRKLGHARACEAEESSAGWRVLSAVSRVSVGAGVIPVLEDGRWSKAEGGLPGPGELMYMRGRFERVVGSRDSEAFYIVNPDHNAGPELSIFLLRT